MTFWKSEIGEVTGKPEDAFTKSFKTIPDETMALAKIESFSLQDHKENGYKYYAINWVLTDGEFKNRKVSQKIKAFDTDAKQKHRALNMLKLIYQLFNIRPSHADAPIDKDLNVFIGKVAGIKIRETEPNDKGNQYNWVSEVHKADGFKCETGVKLVVTGSPKPVDPSLYDSALSRNKNTGLNIYDEDISFLT
jgi:hypothetical protein